jgi:hypothetical protein
MTWPFILVVILQECWVVGLELPPEKQKRDLTRAITFQKIIHSIIHVNLLLPPPSSIAIVVAIKPEAVEEERGETGGVLGVLINVIFWKGEIQEVLRLIVATTSEIHYSLC